MKIRVVSDLHFEFHADAGQSLAREVAAGGFDVLVVAGDLSTFHGLGVALLTICDAAAPRPVVYVLGNHEPYGGTWQGAIEKSRRAQAVSGNLTFLEQAYATIQGRRFVGCTLWFLHSGRHEPFDRTISDFSEIAGIRQWLSETARASARFLAATVQADDIVVTHHLPHPRSIAAPFAGSALNSYFLHDVSETVESGAAALWIHGHTHASANYTVGATRVVCNPFGYARGSPGEPNPAFRPDFDVVV